MSFALQVSYAKGCDDPLIELIEETASTRRGDFIMHENAVDREPGKEQYRENHAREQYQENYARNTKSDNSVESSDIEQKMAFGLLVVQNECEIESL